MANERNRGDEAGRSGRPEQGGRDDLAGQFDSGDQRERDSRRRGSPGRGWEEASDERTQGDRDEIDRKRGTHGDRGGATAPSTSSHLARERSMARGDKGKYTDKQKRMARHIEEGHERRGVSEDEAARRRDGTD